jgi:hypothetical protein
MELKVASGIQKKTSCLEFISSWPSFKKGIAKQNKKPYPTTTITKSQETQQKIMTTTQAYDNLTNFLFLVCAKRSCSLFLAQ